MNWLSTLPYTLQALMATLFTWSVTTAGAACVFFFKTIRKGCMDAMLGFSGGVMIAASFWSLLSPGIDMAGKLGMNPWLTALIGFFGGGLLLFAGDQVFSLVSGRQKRNDAQLAEAASHKRCMMLITSMTLHNIPQGMAVGVAFGSLAYGAQGTTFAAASLLTLGLGLQNFPEGTAVSVPLRREGYSRGRSFLYSTLSGVAEPISSVIGAILVLRVRFLLPYLLAFAAGAVIYVVVEELIPESQTNEKKDVMALFTLMGFSVMMVLDLALG